MLIKLVQLAHCRSGDKGNTSNISVIPYHPEFSAPIKQQLSAEKFKDFYAGVVSGNVTRYCLDKLEMFNFVCEGALGGGVSRSLCLDNYGKSLSSRILSFEIEINDDFKNLLH